VRSAARNVSDAVAAIEASNGTITPQQQALVTAVSSLEVCLSAFLSACPSADASGAAGNGNG
jgi:hypothetical protein